MDTVIEFFAEVGSELLVGTFALLLTIFSAWQSRRHNRLSVRPHLDWVTHRQWSSRGMVIRFSLRNAGIGPAIIKGTAMKIDGTNFEPRSIDPIVDLAAALLVGREHYVRVHEFPGENCALLVGQSICIADIHLPGLTKAREAEIMAEFERADFVVRYESLYRQKFTFTTATIKTRHFPQGEDPNRVIPPPAEIASGR